MNYLPKRKLEDSLWDYDASFNANGNWFAQWAQRLIEDIHNVDIYNEHVAKNCFRYLSKTLWPRRK